VALNLDRALRESRTEHVAILNDDDRWHPGFLATAARALAQDPAIDLFYSDFYCIDEAGRRLEEVTDDYSRRYGRCGAPEGIATDGVWRVLNNQFPPFAMAAVFRRRQALAAGLTAEYAGAYDLWLAAQFAAAGARTWYCPQRLTDYRLHAAMETNRSSSDKWEDQLAIFRRLVRDPRLAPWRPMARARLRFFLEHTGRNQLRHGRYARGCARFAAGAWQRMLLAGSRLRRGRGAEPGATQRAG
jgi:hypothetical protein